jgi:crotonobetainyl-CoA:carnitine CoA-transferase CaiB-like acyl-CoA transferase
MSTGAPQPLDDLVVVELGDSIAAAWAGRLLADLGARVIRVDDLSGGQLYRREPLVGRDQTGLKVSAAWLHLNRNKESVTCRLASDGGRELLDRLFASSDVVIDGLGLDPSAGSGQAPSAGGRPPGTQAVLAGLGFPFAALQEMFPKLVVAVITPFGLNGPYRDLQASDLVVAALGGLLNMVGFPERQPLELGGAQAQYATGLSAFTAIMAAITYRDRAERGQLIDVSMMETVAFVEWKSGAFYEADGRVRYRVGNRSHWLVLEATDGFVALVYQDESFPSLQQLTGIEALNDDRFATRSGRARHADEIRELLAPWFAERSKLEVYHAGQALGIPLGFVATIADLLDSPQYEARGFWQALDHPAVGTARYPGLPYHLTGIELPSERAPVPGEHTESVLREVLGLSSEQVDSYRAQEVI